jgi:hypothetical protein
MGVLVSREDGPIMRRAGFGGELVLLTMLEKPETQWDPYAWANIRTMRNAHLHIQNQWEELTSGQVIDVRVLLGETTEPAISDCQ